VHVLRLLREAGALVDAVSLGEIERALRAGYDGAASRPAWSTPPT
jgi:diaminopimelate decarboxylase